jgi:hypothetical protein
MLTIAAFSCLCLSTMHAENSMITSLIPYAAGAAFPLAGHLLGTIRSGHNSIMINKDQRVILPQNQHIITNNHNILTMQQIFNGDYNNPSLKKSWFRWTLGCGALGILFAAYVRFNGDANTGTKIAVGSATATLITILGTNWFPENLDDSRFGKIK